MWSGCGGRLLSGARRPRVVPGVRGQERVEGKPFLYSLLGDRLRGSGCCVPP